VLPPIGTICETWHDDGRVCWHKAEVVGYHPVDPTLAAVMLSVSGSVKWANLFRPSTERSLAVQEMVAGLSYYTDHKDPVIDVCGQLYDAGYRKGGIK
jgi:hypothetical protein